MNLSGNWHPIFVHFPVAFLSLYATFLFVSFFWKTKQKDFSLLLKILIVLGAVGTVVAATAGERLEESVMALKNPEVTATLIRHSLYAGITQTLAIIALFFEFWTDIRKYIPSIRFDISPLLKLITGGLIFLSMLLTASEGGKLAHTYHVGEKAKIDIAHPVGKISGALIPKKVIDLLQ